jgi:hypothetical protein
MAGDLRMPNTAPSALITDRGRRIHLRLGGRFFALSQNELRRVLGLPEGGPGLGITIDGEHLVFEFSADEQTVEMSAVQLRRCLARQKVPGSASPSAIG